MDGHSKKNPKNVGRTPGRARAASPNAAPGRSRDKGGAASQSRWDPVLISCEALLGALPDPRKGRFESASLNNGLDGLFILVVLAALALGVVAGLVWMSLAAARQMARASQYRHRAKKAGKPVAEPLPKRLAVNRRIDPATVEEHWLKSFRSPMDTLRAGSILLDVECAAGAETTRDRAHFTGRTGGMRQWLLKNAPYIPYQTSMRYKRLAALYREALGVAPELPAEWFLPDCETPAREINTAIRRFASELRTDPRWDREEVERRIASIGEFTDASLAALRKKGAVFCTRRDDGDTVGVEGVTRRLYAALGRYRAPIGPLRRRNAVRTRTEPVFAPSEFRDHAYRDTPQGRANFSVRCALRRDMRHVMFRGHLTNKLHRELDARLPDRAFAAHFAHRRPLSPLQVDPICNPARFPPPRSFLQT